MSGVRAQGGEDELLCSEKRSLHLTKIRILPSVSSAWLPDAAKDCLLSTASNDTFQIFNAWGNFLLNPNVFKLKTVFPSKKQEARDDPPSVFFSSHENIMSWIPLLLCYSAFSRYAVSHCQWRAQFFMFFPSVGKSQAPSWPHCPVDGMWGSIATVFPTLETCSGK